MKLEKNNLVILHEIDYINVFTSDIVTFTDKITNNGEKEKKNIIFNGNITNNYDFIKESIEIDGNKIEGNITDGISLGNLAVGTSITISYKAKAINKVALADTYATVKCSYIDDDSTLKNISKDSNIVESNINDKRLSINLSYDKPNCKIGDINTFTIKLYNYDKNQLYYNVNLKSVLSDNYEFIRNTLTINDEIYNGTNENVIIESLDANAYTIIKFKAKAITVGGATLDAKVSFYYKDTEQTEQQTEVVGNSVLTNIYSDDNDNVIVNLEISPLISIIETAAAFRINIINNGSSNLTNVLVKLPIAPNYQMVGRSLKVNGITREGDINTGITLESVAVGTTTITFFALDNTITDNLLLNATANYTYEGQDGSVTTNRLSNNVYYTIAKARDQLLLWNLSSDKKEYFIGEKMEFKIGAINNTDHLINEINLYSIISDEIKIIKGSTKLDGESIDDINNRLILSKPWNINEERQITFEAVANSALDEAKMFTSMVYSYINDNDTNISSMTESNDWVINIKENENVKVKIDLTTDEGYLLKVNDTVHFNLQITNDNDYQQNLTNVNLLLNNKSDYFTIDETSVKQDDVVLTKDETGKYLLKDIEANSLSTITYSASTIKKTKEEQVEGVTLNYQYLDPNGYAVERTLYDSVDLQVVEETNANITVLKEVNLKECNVEDELHYEVRITNNGEEEIKYLFIKDLFDQNVSFIASSVEIDGVATTFDITSGVVLKSLAPNVTTLIRFKGLASKKGTNNNVAYVVSSLTELTEDSVLLGNVSNIAPTTIAEVINASYKVIKFNNKTDYYVDDQIHFEITVTNNGNVPIKKIKLNEVISEHLEYIKGSLRLDGYKRDDLLTSINIKRQEENLPLADGQIILS